MKQICSQVVWNIQYTYQGPWLQKGKEPKCSFNVQQTLTEILMGLPPTHFHQIWPKGSQEQVHSNLRTTRWLDLNTFR